MGTYFRNGTLAFRELILRIGFLSARLILKVHDKQIPILERRESFDPDLLRPPKERIRTHRL